MADKAGNTGVGDFSVEKPEEKKQDSSVKEPVRKSKKSREGLNNVIKEEKVDNLLKERSDLKKGFSATEKPENVVVKKNKRKRRRKKKPASESFEKPEQKPEIEPEAKEAETLEQELPVQPVNPFVADSYLPPKEYEKRYTDESSFDYSKDNVDDKAKKDNFVNEPVSPFDISDSDVEPINPFKAGDFPHKTLDKKALDEKPLDELIDEHVLENEEEKISPEEIGEAKETFVEGNEDAEQSSMAEREGVVDIKVKEIIDVKPVDEVKDDNKYEPAVSDVDEFKDDVWNVIEQAGITKKKLVVILVCFGIFVFVLLFFLMGWYKIFTGGDGVDNGKKVENTEVDSDVSGAGVYSLVSSYIFGLEYSVPLVPIEAKPIGVFGDILPIDAALIFGNTKGVASEKFIGYVDLLRKLQNIYQTDVYIMMDSALDRRAVLNSHLIEMDNLITATVQSISELDADIERLSSEYSQVVEEKDVYEKAFFSNAQELYGVQAQQNLDFFIEFSKRASEIKAQHSADSTVRKMLINSLSVLQPRYQDIQSNIDALVKGVRMFDIPGSDIKAIIRLDK